MLIEVHPPAPALPARVERAVPPAWRRAAGRLAPFGYVAPAIAGIGLWIYRPLVQTVQYSFYNWDLLPTSPKLGVGWKNYDTLFHLGALWQAAGVTGVYAASLLVFGLVVPLAVGVLAQRLSPRARTFYRGLIFLPVLVSPVVTATLWQFLLSPLGGIVDRILARLGFAQTNWLQQANTAKYAVSLIGGWKVIGLGVLIVTAGLAAISGEYYEAAAIDGASRLQVLRRLTLPLLSPTITFLFITLLLLSSQLIFPLLNVLTQGGPSGSTTDLYYFLYEYGFQSFDVGLASAAAVCFFVAYGAVALVCVRLLERFSFYDN